MHIVVYPVGGVTSGSLSASKTRRDRAKFDNGRDKHSRLRLATSLCCNERTFVDAAATGSEAELISLGVASMVGCERGCGQACHNAATAGCQRQQQGSSKPTTVRTGSHQLTARATPHKHQLQPLIVTAVNTAIATAGARHVAARPPVKAAGTTRSTHPVGNSLIELQWRC